MHAAIVLINAELGKEQELISELRKIECVTDVFEVYGVYDIVVKIESESLEQLKITCSRTIRSLKNVRTTLSMMVV